MIYYDSAITYCILTTMVSRRWLSMCKIAGIYYIIAQRIYTENIFVCIAINNQNVYSYDKVCTTAWWWCRMIINYMRSAHWHIQNINAENRAGYRMVVVFFFSLHIASIAFYFYIIFLWRRNICEEFVFLFSLRTNQRKSFDLLKLYT